MDSAPKPDIYAVESPHGAHVSFDPNVYCQCKGVSTDVCVFQVRIEVPFAWDTFGRHAKT